MGAQQWRRTSDARWCSRGDTNTHAAASSVAERRSGAAQPPATAVCSEWQYFRYRCRHWCKHGCSYRKVKWHAAGGWSRCSARAVRPTSRSTRNFTYCDSSSACLPCCSPAHRYPHGTNLGGAGFATLADFRRECWWQLSLKFVHSCRAASEVSN